jgi:hypothetical protein
MGRASVFLHKIFMRGFGIAQGAISGSQFSRMMMMKGMRKPIGVVLLIAAAFLGDSLVSTPRTFAQLGVARVKVQVLPVYSKISVASGIVKTLKKGEVVQIHYEITNADAKWCNISEYGEQKRIGFVACEALEDIHKERLMGESPMAVSPTPPSKPEGPSLSQPWALSFPRTNQSPPSPGDFLTALWKSDLVKVREYLDQGADPNMLTAYGTRPLLIAVKKDNPDLVSLLIQYGAHIEGKDRNGLTPLMAAIAAGQTANVYTMLEAGADINARDQRGLTPLMWATIRGFPQLVEVLLRRDAMVNLKTSEGYTALRLSRSIIADIEKSIAQAEKAEGEPKETLKLKKDLFRHEKVFKLLEEAGGR